MQSNAVVLSQFDRKADATIRRASERRPAKQRPDRTPAVLAERKRLSRELHDAVGQSLTTLLMQIRLASARGAVGLADLRLLEITTQRALDQARALAYGLRETQRDPLGEVRRMSEQMLAEQGCVLVWLDDRTRLDIAVGVAREVSAVIKESVTNIARHARADRAMIRLESPGRRLRVTVEDNGIGFEPELVRLTPDGRGLGLLGMSERLEELGGSIVVSSRLEKGTIVVLEADRAVADPPAWAILPGVPAGA